MCLTVHLQKKDSVDLSSVTVEKFHTPTLNAFATGGRLDKPARCGGVRGARAWHVRAHKYPHAAPTLGCQLQPPGFAGRQQSSIKP